MDFSRAIEQLSPKLNRLINIINDESVSPELRKAALQSVFDVVGTQVFLKAYDMTAWDLDVAETTAPAYDRTQAVGMARNVSDAIATGDIKTAKEQSLTYMLVAIGAAQGAAFATAGAFDKHRVLKVRLIGRGDCDWCRARAARSPIFNPTNQDFSRHNHCNCILKVEGFQSRNGTLKNYTKR